MALQLGGASEILGRNRNLLGQVQSSPTFADFIGLNRGAIFDTLTPANQPPPRPAVHSFGSGNSIFGTAPRITDGHTLIGDRQRAEKQQEAAKQAFDAIPNEELAGLLGGATLANLPTLNLAGEEYATRFTPYNGLIPLSFSDDSGGVYSGYQTDTPSGYNVGETPLSEVFQTMRNADPSAIDASLQSSFDSDLAREAAAGPGFINQAIMKLAAAGMLAGAVGASGITKGLKIPGLGSAANANAVPGLSTGVTTPLGGGAIVGSGQASPLLGIMGGAPLGASPLAITGGATALPGVQGLPSGRIPGTNVNVGTPGGGSAFKVDPSDVLRAANTLSQITQQQPAPSSGGMSLPGLPYRAPAPYTGNPYPNTPARIPAYMQFLRA